MAEQEYKRHLLQTDRLSERNRGLLWLGVITIGMLWIAGAQFSNSRLRFWVLNFFTSSA